MTIVAYYVPHSQNKLFLPVRVPNKGANQDAFDAYYYYVASNG